MAYDVHINSLDIDNRRFVLDEVSTFQWICEGGDKCILDNNS